MRDLQLGRIGRAIGWSGIAVALAAASQSISGSKPEQITGIRAFLFNSQTGGWSPNIANGDLDLNNIGAAPYYSSSTFVIVDVDAGSGQTFGNDAKLRLTAVRGSNLDWHKIKPRLILDAVQRVYSDGGQPVSHLGFWLPENGCNGITLTATLTADGKTYTKKGSLHFLCSE